MRYYRGFEGLDGRTALADACVEDLGEDFVAAWGWDWVVVFEFDGAAEVGDQGDGLGLRND